MLDPLSLLVSYGGYAIGAYCLGYAGVRLFPKRGYENYRELLRITFVRSGLSVKVSKGKHTYDQTPEIVSFEQLDWGFRFTCKLMPGMSINQIRNKKEYFDSAFNGETVSIHGEGNKVVIEIARQPLPDMEYWNLDKFKKQTEGMAIPVPIGMTRCGMMVVDLTKTGIHGFCGGSSGAGKSVFIRGFLSTLIALRTQQQVLISGIDLKMGNEFSMFRDHFYQFAKELDELEPVFNTINELMTDRGRLFEEKGCLNIQEYNRKHEPLPFHLIIFDEIGELPKDYHLSIERIVKIGRSLGFHFFSASQYPNVDVLTTAMKSNMSLSISFQVKNQYQSRAILDNDNAKNIPPISGRGIVQTGNMEQQFQTLYLDEERARGLMKRLAKERGLSSNAKSKTTTVERKATRDNVVYL